MHKLAIIVRLSVLKYQFDEQKRRLIKLTEIYVTAQRVTSIG